MYWALLSDRKYFRPVGLLSLRHRLCVHTACVVLRCKSSAHPLNTLQNGCKSLIDTALTAVHAGQKRLLLSIKADLENVTDFAPAADDFEYFFQVCFFFLCLLSLLIYYPSILQVKCNSCHETHPKFVAVNRLVCFSSTRKVIPL